MTNAGPTPHVPSSTPPAAVASRIPTYVIGHRNPDADAICSAIAYAAFKEARGERGYVAARCGNSNARIDTILRRFHQPLPLYLSDVSPRVHDLMTADVISIPQGATCAEALELIDQHAIRILPVVGPERSVVGTVSLAHLGGVFIPRVSEPRLMRQVHTSLAHMVRALRGKALNLVKEQQVEQLFVRLGTMDVSSFWAISIRENIPAEKSIIVVGDRTDIQRRAIDIGIRALIITGNNDIDAETLALARARGVSVIQSPYDSATTAWVVRTASTIDRIIDRDFKSVGPDTRIADIRKLLAPTTAHELIVTSDEGCLIGIITKSDVLKPVQTRLVLVDHNELTQAVPGAEEVTITEVIDHHRLGALNTAQPILFINEPVGSTCTIVADLFRREGITPTPDIAGVMMSGLISDTLHLNGPTTTAKDARTLAWLAEIAGMNPKQLADEIFNSGSVILAVPPEKVVRSDLKVYEEQGIRYAVSQVEELGFGNFWRHAKPIADALEALCTQDRLDFAALLVTDINTQNSLLIVKGGPEVVRRINYPHVEQDEIFDLQGIVSRKKQLIPYLTSLLKEMAADGTTPAGSPNALKTGGGR
ncbi:putative manganese-dependent inorganic diphosphatase [Opitutus sp. ER46]|uniref:putative manganese-dependent inorganic diphosphatase n=1 Tax=Opitutus sp. ER46 TaxID=2161864 RepID=UPI000D31CE80|nr:putative manganese-dependent inorganic diphosphatase [Opitutus sp. ER46]PTX98963.1 putative manganese-dependent inorganic diphosphatase [Opitutus sp. ER46]